MSTANLSLIQNLNPTQGQTWGHLYGSTRGLLIAETTQQNQHLSLVITADTREAIALESEINFYLKGTDIPILAFPDWETLPYDHFSPHSDIVAQRLTTLYHLPTTHHGVLIAPVATIMQRLLPQTYLNSHALLLKTGTQLDREQFRSTLEQAGYRHTSQVMEHGEFAIRGSLIDLFPPSSKLPFRIDLFDDEIESIRTFDPADQRTIDKIEKVELLPAREFPLNENSIKYFRQRFRESFDTNAKQGSIYRDVSNGFAPTGIEYYLPLFFEQTATLFDFLPENYSCFASETADAALEAFWLQINNRYEQQRHDIERPLLSPDTLYLTPTKAREYLKARPPIELKRNEIDLTLQKDGENFVCEAPPSLPINPRIEAPLTTLKNFIAEFSGRILFAVESAGRREALLDMLHGARIRPQGINSWRDFLSADTELAITVDLIEDGCVLPHKKLAVITEKQLLGERAKQNRRRRAATRDADAVIANLSDLHPGAPVVHLDHGVGRYLGMTTLDVGDIETEFLTLEYAGQDKLYVPVSSLHLVSRYTGTDAERAPLHRLGGEQWQKLKKKAAQKAHDVAVELLELYAKRAARQGHAFQHDKAAYAQFAAGFPFEETEDQAKAIQATIDDMQTVQPMDRVVCGDVGFGKTEVAMRAAFVAVEGSKQVAILVPTTLLAQQHNKNFCDRFADWPVRVEVMSRFQTGKQQTQAIKDLADGKIDIVIGTHKLLQNSIKFQNLGLVIIDEEHRFGVRHKEKLKALRAEVDLLTLTATPIPRTLNMSLAGLRDLSIIATPPAHRHAIKTFVNEWNDSLILEACQRELARGGQIYFVHNEVKTIERIARQVSEVIPQASIRVAHGQMPERDLEQVMLDFYHQRFNILVCTTIVESGIDVPTANTIIINRADKLGLAQLHQLRGRVGRSHHRAYAYLFSPPRNLMTSDAEKRLDAIESLEDLGVGFTLATHDMEIRGAGELLGDEQSGQIHEIGFTLYSELLERAVAALKAGHIPDYDEPLKATTEVDLRVAALIPADYMPDVHNRLILYKRIASAADRAALRELQVEMIDRFGLLPDPVKNLIRVTELKLAASALGIQKLELTAGGGRTLFNTKPNVDPAAIIKLVQSAPATYRFEGADKLKFNVQLESGEERFEFCENLLQQLQGPSTQQIVNA